MFNLTYMEDSSGTCAAVLDPLYGAIVTLKDGDPGDLDPGGIIKIIVGVKVAAEAVTTAVGTAVGTGVGVAVATAVNEPPPPPPMGNTNCGPDNNDCKNNVDCDGNTKCEDNSKCYGNTNCDSNNSCKDQNGCPKPVSSDSSTLDENSDTSWW